VELAQNILSMHPKSVFEFGCGSGKNLKIIKDIAKENGYEIETCGLDISIVNVFQAHCNGVDSVIRGDERHFPLRKFDVVFSCSVLDHIEDIGNIIGNMQSMATKAILLAETNSFDHDFYYKHNYESFGFVKLDYEFISPDDKGIYSIWKYEIPDSYDVYKNSDKYLKDQSDIKC
jgi:SAM-dependent methyltransferase